MNEAHCKKWAKCEWEDPAIGKDIAENSKDGYRGFFEAQKRLKQAAEWALEQYKLREKETNALLERNGYLKAKIRELEAQLERANLRA